MEEQKKKNTFELILKIIIAVASAIAGALGATACKGLF
ncbi:MAG: smalltalk protein [Bacteroides sp.]|nr:smalltalk protein [Bacteroides sp.]MBR4048623.1 smalltalk protein [Bacteroides sp.]